jgi:acetyl/propionyl-CoA carboxylase alpha subunit
MRRMPFPNYMRRWAVGEIDVNHAFEMNGEDHQIWLSPRSGGYRLRLGDKLIGPITFSEQGDGRGILVIAGEAEPVRFAIDGETIHLHLRGETRILRYLDPLRTLASADSDAGHLIARAPMPGVVVATKVSSGEVVSTGSALMVIESMKLETVIRAPKDAVVDQVHFKEGDSFERDAILVTLSEQGS